MSKYAKLLILGAFVIMACGPYVPFHEFYSLFYNDVASPEKNKFYNYYSNNYYDYNDYYNWEEQKDGEDSVLMAMNYEWEKYTNGKIKAKVFEEAYSNFDKQDELIKMLFKINLKEAAEYFILLWDARYKLDRIEEYQYQNQHSSIINSLSVNYKTSIQSLLKTKDNFLIMRYLYLISRIELHLDGVIELPKIFEKYKSKINFNSVIYPMLINNYAGSLYRSGRKAESFYHFAQLFNKYPSLRENTFISIKAYEIPFTAEVEKYCKTNDELANVYAMAAIQPKIDGLPFIEKIYAKKPDHELIELIFNREINKMEQLYFSSYKKKFEFWEEVEVNDKGGKKHLKRLQNLCTKVIDEKKINLTFWYLSNSYFHFLNDSLELARKNLLLAKPTNRVSKEQIDRLNILIDLSDSKISSDDDISNLVMKFEQLRKIKRMEDASLLNHCGLLLKKKLKLTETYMPKESKSIFSGCSNQDIKKTIFTNNQKARIFAIDLLTSFIGENIPYALFANERQIIYDTTKIDFLESFEDVFLNSYNLNPIDKNLLNVLELDSDGFYTALGRKYVLNRDFEAASASYSKISEDGLNYLKSDFYLSLNDSLFYEHQRVDSISTYLKNILRDKISAENKNELAIYKYAIHLYNLSYYGQFWTLSKSYRTVNEPYFHRNYPVGYSDFYMPTIYYNLTDISEFLQKHPVNDKEIKAKIDYLKIYIDKLNVGNEYQAEINTLHEKYPEYNADNNSEYDSWRKKVDEAEEKYSFAYEKSMKKLFNDYYKKHRNTEYGKRVLKECSTAGYYIDI